MPDVVRVVHDPGMSVVLLIVGLAVGAALGLLYAKSRSAAEIARLDATLRAARDGEERLGQSLDRKSVV